VRICSRQCTRLPADSRLLSSPVVHQQQYDCRRPWSSVASASALTKSASAGADDDLMERKGDKRAVPPSPPGCSGAKAEASHRRTDLCSDLFFVVAADPFTVLMCHRRTRLWIGIQPVQNQCFDNSLRIGEVLGAVIFECLKQGRIEAVGSLDRFGFRLTWRMILRFAWRPILRAWGGCGQFSD
jgi:hypothetical protein